MSKPKGFTLIELLVVISIIVLLMAILLPVVQRVRNQARAVVCRANLKQWGTILALYTEDNEGQLPPDSLWFLRGSYVRDNDPDKPPVFHNLSTKGIACCPMAVRVRSPGTGGSYGFNHEMPNSNISFVKGKGNVPVLLDCPKWSGRHWESVEPPPFEDIRGFGLDFCINRHDGYVNGLFLDWSVRRIGLKELWTLKWNSEFDTANIWTRAGGVQPEDWPQWMRNFKDY